MIALASGSTGPEPPRGPHLWHYPIARKRHQQKAAAIPLRRGSGSIYLRLSVEPLNRSWVLCFPGFAIIPKTAFLPPGTD